MQATQGHHVESEHVTQAQAVARASSCNIPSFSLRLAPIRIPQAWLRDIIPARLQSSTLQTKEETSRHCSTMKIAFLIILLGPNERLTSSSLWHVMTLLAEQQPQVGLQVHGLNWPNRYVHMLCTTSIWYTDTMLLYIWDVGYVQIQSPRLDVFDTKLWKEHRNAQKKPLSARLSTSFLTSWG